MKDIGQFKQQLKSLFGEQYFAVLATGTSDQIHTTLVAFAVTDDLKTFFLCTPRTTRKYANLKKNPTVSLMVHNSSNQATDVRQAIAVTVSGVAKEAPAERLATARTVYLARQPHMSDFAHSPNTAIIEVSVSRYDLVAHFQEVTILDIHQDQRVSQ